MHFELVVERRSDTLAIMKYPQYITLLALTVPVITFAQTKDKPAAAAGSADGNQAIMAIEKELLAGVLRADAAAVERHLATGYVFVAPNGETEGKVEMMNDLTSGKLKLTSSEPSDMKVVASDADMAW